METIGKLFAVLILASAFATGTFYILENGFFASSDTEDVTVSSSISDALFKSYKKKLRDEYYELKKDKVANKENSEYVEKPMWKFEYDKKE